MKALIAVVFAFTSLIASADGFNDSRLDHQDIVEFSEMNQSKVEFSINYPGLDFTLDRSNTDKDVDCLVVQTSQMWPEKRELQEMSEKVLLADGPGVFLGQARRAVNALEPVIERTVSGKWELRFHLKDLGTYVTGLRVVAYSPYVSIDQIVKSIFKENASKVRLQFLRGCRR